MKTTTFSKSTFIILFLLLGIQSFSQNYVNFTKEFDQDLKGDILLIGNNILGPDNNAFNDGTVANHNVDMQYIDIDGDASTFNSTSADLVIPNPNCYNIVHAGLYWGAVTRGTEAVTDVRFKGPTGGYNDVTGTIIYDAGGVATGNSFPYSCYADVTAIVTGLANDQGTYTVGNVSTAVGETSTFDPYNGTGYSAGWSLFIVYEDPTLPGKSITSFNGFSAISSTVNADVDISGFRTVPAPAPVRANFAFAALEGDSPFANDRLLINNVSMSTADRLAGNFFNSSVTQLSALPVNNRNPNSTNTLGFDTGVMVVPNPGNSVIANDATSATVSLESTQDIYFPYFFAFAVDIIEPNIVLTKIVEDDLGNDIGGQNVTLGQPLNYVIGFQNAGNDNATSLTIRDILPINIVFDYPAGLVLPPGVTVQSYDPVTRELVFSVEDSYVEEGDPYAEIRIEVEVVPTCSELDDACSNIVNNQAFATYSGFFNPDFLVSDDPSVNSNTGCLLSPQATNFLVDLDDCDFTENEILCGDSVDLTAADGYDIYTWSTSPTGTPVIGTTQTITVTATGTYYVHNEAPAPCQSIDQIFVVTTFGGNITNPVIPYADEVVICPNDGDELPNIYLCGADDSRFIQTNISTASSIIWEQLDEASCPPVSNTDCANEDGTCTWNQVGTGADFLANAAGQFRLTINYDGGCFNQFYFNVYQNLLDPTAIGQDIICDTPGQITVGGVPNGYEYSLNIGGPYQTSNVFSIDTPGFYTVYIIQTGAPTNPCVFTVPDIQIRERDFTVSTTVTQPICNGELGSIMLAANDVEPQYFFSIYDGATLVNSVGPIVENNYTFANLNPGTYTTNVSTEDGCTYTGTVTIVEPPLLTTTAAITAPLTCTEGEITIYPLGGTPPYFYFINSTTVFQTHPEIVVTAAGTYDITVVDSNNCSADTTITIEDNPAPVYTISQTDVLCYNEDTGEIQINVTNANGYTLEYSIDNGVTFISSATFSNLPAGDYEVIIRYTLAGSECLTTAETITIAQPDEALTASAGVSELAGCGPAGEGLIRITNPQGGTPFPAPNLYEYSFDNQATWTTNNEAYVLPGTYTVYIRDANGCIYAMTDVILDPEPLEPTIELDEPIYNCDGSANATVTVTNTGSDSYSYEYLLNGVPNPNTADPNIFLDVPVGSHTITVEYTLLTPPTYSNLLYETFGYGEDTTSPGINATYYCFERQVVATQCNGSPAINDGDYSVTSNIVNPFGAWVNPADHTPATTPPTPDGRYLVVNIGATIPQTEVLYEKQINDIIPNQPINVEFFAINLLKIGNTQFDPNLRVALVDAGGTEISWYNTGDIPKTENWIQYPTTPITLDPGANTSLKFIVRSNVQQTSGNDVAIDDIRVYQLPVACTTTVDFPFVIPAGNAFTADVTGFTDVTCLGLADGTVTIAAQNFDPALGFQYSINGGAWVTQMTSPHTITGLADGTYDIQIRYDDSPDTCLFSFTQVIGSPDPMVINVTNTPVQCTGGATVTATATGGTPGYSFQLIDTVSPFTVTDFPGNGILTDVAAGVYTVQVTDAFGCMESTTLTLDSPTPPTATISPTSDLCYDATNEATLEVNASGGQAPYEYSINGGPFQSSNIFDDLIPGTYTITVRDAFGCTVTLPAETIEPQLRVNTVLTKDLDCTVTPDAIITGTIDGGYAPYTYEVSINGGAYAPLGAATTPFTYTTATDGTYQFQVTDSQGCTAESTVITVAPISMPEITSVTQIEPILCNGDANAAIEVIINTTVGTPAFVINVHNDTTGVDYGTQTSGLTAGIYTITLTDSKSCTDTETIIISEPDPIVVAYHTVDITCTATGVSQGSVIVDSVTGGTAPYDYFVTGTNGYDNSESNASGTTSVSFDVVDFGLYQINVIDSNGCSVLIQDVLVASPPDDLDITIDATVDCSTGGEAVVSIGTTLSSSGPFFFSIYQGPISIYPNPPGSWIPEDAPGSQTATFTGLIPGVLYTFIVYDASTNCSYYEPATTPIPTNSTLTTSAVSSDNITCTGSADGDVSFTVNSIYGVDTDITYEIFDSLTLNTTGISGTGTVPAGGSLTVDDLGPLPFGNYFVLITETSGPNSGCSVVTAPFNITESAIPLDLSASVDQNANCNLNSGVISAIAQNGTAPYQYQMTTTPGSPLATDPAWATNSTFNANAGSYYVHVLDAYGCIVSTPVIVLPMDPTPVISAVLNNQCTAVEGAFTIDVALTTTGIAPHSYSIDGGAFQTMVAPFTISNLSSGTHTVEVNDANGCGNLVSVTIESPLGLTPTITALPTCADDDGEITVATSGGTGTYTYAISPNPGSIVLTGNVFSGVPSGTYTITMTDVTTTCTLDATVTLSPATPVTFTTTVENVNCNGGNEGVITVDLPVSNDNPIYTYEITAPITVGPQNSNVFTGLSAGTYTVQVNSGRGCIATDTVDVLEPAVIDVPAPAVTQYVCNPGTDTMNFATITVTGVTGGSGTYVNYEFIRDGVVVQFSSSNVYTESDLAGGTYTINVYDDEGCIGSTLTAIVIDPYIDLDTVNVTVDNAITCTNLEDITVSVTTIGGTPTNMQYTVEDVDGTVIGGVYSSTNATGTFTGLDIGNYIITVENLDSGCSLQTVHYVNDPNTFDIDVDSVVDVTCFNDTDGSVNITFIDQVVTATDPDDAGPFSYTIDDDQGNLITSGTTTNAGPINITGLAGGTYTVSATLTNSPFCSVSRNFTITRPTAALDLTASETSNVTCTNDQGSIVAVATGGWSSTYVYELELLGAVVETNTNGTFTDLAAGVYTVNVSDTEGCIVSETVTLLIPTPIDATFSPNTTLLSCFGDADATITVSNVTGGQGGNYTYTLNSSSPSSTASGPQTSPVFTDLAAGTYTITINDGYDCSLDSGNIVIAEPTQVQASLVTATTQTCLTDATLTLTAAGGTGSYTYSDDISFATVLGAFTTSTTISVTPGTYVYYVMDANGCIANASNEITIETLPPLVLNLDVTNATINCAGDDTGVIVATAQGGLGNYVYTLQDTSGNTIPAVQDSPGVFTELLAGTYQIMVDSGDCVTTTSPIAITEPDSPLLAPFAATDVTCFGANNGSVVINATGGTGIIKYAISPQLNQFFDTNTFENLEPGDYEVIVQDVLGCYLNLNFTINEPDALFIGITTLIPEICDGDNDGEFSIDITGGTAPYSVSLDDYNGVYTTGTISQTVFDFTDLSGGDHIVYIRDNFGCESEWNITFPESVLIDPMVVVDYTCEGNSPTNTVTVTVDESITDPAADLDYSLDDGPYQASNVFNNVAPGTHYIDVRHTNGCIKRTELFEIIGFEQLTLFLNDGELNEIVAVAGGGAGGYEYTLNDVPYGDVNVFTITESGDYTVTVTDNNGCVAVAVRHFDYIDVCIPDYFTPNGDGVEDGWAPGCAENYDSIDVSIFDRYGRKVAVLREGQTWDGKYNEVELPTGDYWYVVKVVVDSTNEREFVGHFTLYR